MKKETIGPVIIVLIIIFLVATAIIMTTRARSSLLNKIKREQTDLYEAWAKVTGNPKKLTEEEFTALKKNFMLGKIKDESK